MPRNIVGWYVRDNGINRAEFAKYIGRTLRDRPAPNGPVVSPVIRCCGSEVVCEDFTNTCDHCGADYNFNGDRLAPRSQWGEETGEHWSECY